MKIKYIFISIALLFGYMSFQLDFGNVNNIGPGLLPFVYSMILLVIGLIYDR